MLRPIIRFTGWFLPLFALVLGFGTLAENFAQPSRPGSSNTNTQCSALVQAALSSTDSQCSDTSRNQACYGHILNEAVSRPEVETFVFDERGDKVLLQDVVSIDLSPLELTEELWGVVLMQVQANLPDALPGQNVTFILFGDIQVENAVGTPVEREATLLAAANIRVAPGESRPVLASLASGQTVVTNGKTMTSAGEVWVRVNHDPDREIYGWMLSDLLEVDLSELPDVEVSDQTVNPMQAFYFKTGIGVPQCVEAPEDGILVQTPNGAGMVNFSVNGMDIGLGSTAYLTAPEDEGHSCVYLLEGESDITALDETVTLEPGYVSCVELDEEGIAASKPSEPVLYDRTTIVKLADLLPLLPEDIELPDIEPTVTPTPTNTRTFIIPPAATATPTPTDVPPQPEQPQQPAPTTAPTATSTLTPTPLPDCPSDGVAAGPCRPVADFGYYIQYAVSDLTVQFLNNAYGDITNVSWDFGDGNTSTDYDPQHTYASPGTYSVRLRVQNAYANDVVRQDVVLTNATPVPPVASFTQTTDIYTVTFTDTSSPGAGTITTWQWDFGHGGAISNQPSPTYTYPLNTAGNYTVTLTVTDSNGASDSEIITVSLGGCEYAPSGAFTLTFNRNATDPVGTAYEIYLKNADCTYGTASGILNQVNPSFSAVLPANKGYLVRQVAPCTIDFITNGFMPAGGETVNVFDTCP
ncbi:MAG: PKD domain-containing protein [Anaerolineae bacterium]|nr:PKD domain-containing protein [Anaerolineae bacterium]